MWKRRLSAIGFGAIVVAGLLVLRAGDPFAVRTIRDTTFDVYQQIRPRSAPDDLPVRIVDIDEKSLRQVGQWPWSRQVMATIASRLTELGAAVVAFDVLFPEADRLSPAGFVDGAEDYDVQFAQALSAAPSVLVMSRSGQGDPPPPPKAGFAFTGAETLGALPVLDGAAAPLPLLADVASGLGVASLDREGAGVARRLPLLWSNGTSPLPTLSLEALRIAQGVSTMVVLGDAAGTVSGLRVGGFDIPTGPTGEMWLYYRDLPASISVSASDLLADNYRDLAPLLAGHIVLVGTSAAGLLDIRVSALGEAVPGVSIHAQALEQMLTGTFLHRADWVQGLELLGIAISGMAIVLVLLLTGPLVGLLFSIMIASVSAAASWWAFAQYGVLIDPSFALFAALVTYAAMAFFQFAVTDGDRRRIRKAFAHYVEPSLMTQIEGDERLLRLGGDMRDLTVMFSDVRNFTALSERTPPTVMVNVLNRLFAVLGAAIVAHRGTIDKFMGDAVMAFWNAPVDVDSHARRACEAALDMREALMRLNTSLTEIEPISIGIGISTGPALVGNMGFEKRFDYSCIGDTVNTASRLENSCKTVCYDILVTAEVRMAAPEMAYLEAGSLRLKGIAQPEPIHLLVGDAELARSTAFLALVAAHDTLLDLLASGADPHDAVRNCATLGAPIDVRLVDFFGSCAGRKDDFARPALLETLLQPGPIVAI